MIDKTLRQKAYGEYKKHRLMSWALSLFVMLIIGAIVLLSILIGGIMIFVAPLLILPLVFAAYLSHLGFSYNGELTFTSFFRFFLTYFKRPYNGTFRYWVSLLKYLICLLAMEILFTLVATLICVSIEPVMFMNMIKILYEASLNSIIINNPVEVFGETYQLYIIFNNIMTVPTSLVSLLFVFYLLTLNSLSLYLRIKLKQANNQFIDLVFKHAIKADNNIIRKNFFNLEWPMFLLFAIGMVVGSSVTLAFTNVPEYMILNGVMCGIISIIFFVPFHFSNMEVLYKRFELIFLNSVNDVSKSIFERFNHPNPQEETKEEDDNKKPS